MASPKPLAVVLCSAVISSEESSVVQVLDSNDPLVANSSLGPSCVQVLDSNEPLVPVIPSLEQEAGCSRATAATAALLMPAAMTWSEGIMSGAEPRASGSSGRRIHYCAEEIRSHWNMIKILTRLGTTAQCIQFAEERRLILREKMCRIHRKPMVISYHGSGPLGSFRCRKSNCRNKAESRAKGTLFENIRLPVDLVFQIMYMFSHRFSYLQVQVETARDDRETVLSTTSIADWYSHCRETIIKYELEHQEAEGKIGGPGKRVQLDESKFEKRKYNRGRDIESHWVLGMIEEGSDDLRLEVCPNNERTAEVLMPLIQKHVQEGTEIHTGFWSAYDCLPQHGYIHKKVNHTQRSESQCHNLKVLFKKDHYKGNFTDWLIEYSWRRKIRISHKDPFEELLKAIEHVYKIV